MMLVSLISYIDRNTLALLAPTILKETGLSVRDYGFIISAFSIAYMLGNPFWGGVLDRVGLRRGMLGAVGLWTLASAAHAFAHGFLSFGFARVILGFGEGATFPGGLRTVVQTLTVNQRSRGIALAYSGGSLGAVITPLIITPVAAVFGWRGAFWFTGLVGLAWLAAWSLISRRPDIRTLPKAHGDVAPALPLRDPKLWSFAALYGLGGLPLAFVLYGSSIYLSRVLGKTQLQIGAVLWIPPLGWELGYFFWGWFIDRFGHLRELIPVLALLTLPLALTPQVSSYVGALCLMGFGMFIGAGYIIGAMAYGVNRYSSRHSGFIAGVGAGTWSAVVAILMPVFGELFDQNRYGLAFALAAVIPALGSIVWILLNPALETRRRP